MYNALASGCQLFMSKVMYHIGGGGACLVDVGRRNGRLLVCLYGASDPVADLTSTVDRCVLAVEGRRRLGLPLLRCQDTLEEQVIALFLPLKQRMITS